MKIERWKFFYMFMMFMWVASATPLTGFNISKNPILMPIYLLIIAYYWVKYCKNSLKPIIVYISLFTIWYTISCLKYDSIQSFPFPILYSIIIAHIAFNIFSKEEFLYLYENILVKLCVLSLIVWIGANILPNTVPSFMHAIAVIENNPPTETNSFIVGMGSQFTMGIRRNIGFTWEPGRFACWIILGMYVNLIINKFKIGFNNRNLYILLFSLLSTMSTTGYSLLGVIILFYVINKKGVTKLFITILSIALIPSIAGLAFMGEKITTLLDIENDIQSVYYFDRNGADIVTPQRFAGLYFDSLNFVHDFWFGYNQNEHSYITDTYFNGITVTMSDGVINILSKYGVFVGMFFYYWLFRSSIYLSKSLQYNGKYIFAFLFLAMSISYDFWENCTMMFFYFSAFYNKYSQQYFKSADNKDNSYFCTYFSR